MEWYLLMFSDEKKAAEYAWGIMVGRIFYSEGTGVTNMAVGSNDQTCALGKPALTQRHFDMFLFRSFS